MPKTCFAPAAVFGSKQIESKSAFVLGKVTIFGCQVVLWHQKSYENNEEEKGLGKVSQEERLGKAFQPERLGKVIWKKGFGKAHEEAWLQ